MFQKLIWEAIETQRFGYSEQLSSLLDTLKQQLQFLPTEEPVGSQDIYGQDISLSFFSDDFQWSNGEWKYSSWYIYP